MSIIYTFPIKSVPVAADLILISDSEDKNKTKQVTVSSLPSGGGSGGGVVTSLTTTGTSGVSTLNSGVLNIPNYATGGSGSAPAGGTGSVQFRSDTGTFAGDSELIYDGEGGLTLGEGGGNKGVITLIGSEDDDESGLLKIGHLNLTKYLSLALGNGTMAADYSILFPVAAPGGNNKILESSSTGALSWIDTPSGSGTPGTPLNSIQFNSSSSFSGSAFLTFTFPSAVPTLTIGDASQDTNGIIEIQGESSNPGALRIGGGSQTYYTTIQGSPSDTANYKVVLPTAGPGGNNKILESTSAGILSWIDTPSGTSGALDGFETLPFTTANGYLAGENASGTYVFSMIAPSNCTPENFKLYNFAAQTTTGTTTVAIYKGVMGSETAAGSLHSTGEISGALGAAQISGSTFAKQDGAASISAGDNIVICFSIDEQIKPLGVIPITASGGITLTSASPVSNSKLAVHDPNVSLTASEIKTNALTVSALEALLTTSAATTSRPFLLIY